MPVAPHSHSGITPAAWILFPGFGAPSFFEETPATRTGMVSLIIRGILEVIFLMILFGRIEWLCGQDFRHDWLRKFACLSQHLFRRFRCFFLLFVAVEDRG